MIDLEYYKKSKQLMDEAYESIGALAEQIKEEQEKLMEQMRIASEASKTFSNVDEKHFLEFLKRPWGMLPRRKNEWWVFSPKAFQFQIGWLDHSDEVYNYFIVNKYMSWLSEIPSELKSQFKFKPTLPLKVIDGVLYTGKNHQGEAWDRYNRYLTGRKGEDQIRIKRGAEFKLIAEMISDGILPFTQQPVEQEDLREPTGKITLRSYQQRAWEKFLSCGAIGVFWAFSAGKSFFGAYACDRIRGKKLIVVPTVTLREQWYEYLRNYTQCKINEEVVVTTYQSVHKWMKYGPFSLVIFDEAHRLPANTYAKCATIQTKYRIGLSATPHREDGRTEYIFSLTGFPVGLNWEELIELGFIEPPDIRLYIFQHYQDKTKKLIELVSEKKKTIVFCDSIRQGKRLSVEIGVPFIYSGTSNKLEAIRKGLEDGDTIIVSRVGDEGISLPNIERTIEIDFLFGSRRQEGQRAGRVFHGEKKGEHIILMTEAELKKYEKRLYALYEKGLKIQVIR